jgi:SAM-dependent methyltransferase
MTRRLTNVEQALTAIAIKYPQSLVGCQLADVRRIAFNIGLVVTHVGTDGFIVDLGGGIGLFSIGCAALGMRACVIDDFGDGINAEYGDGVLQIHKSYGVKVLRADVLSDTLPKLTGTVDAITCFDSMEHWHRSPKRLFAWVMDALRAGGIFVLGVPNRANLRKRLAVPLGYGRWSSMKDWYESAEFRGHVREPDVTDLRYIARDMGLTDWRVYGRNWAGYASQYRLVRMATYVSDLPLRLFPSLCAEIYLLGNKL